MNDLRKATITTLEVAEMMEVPHGDLLKKIEGRKDRKGYIQILNEGQMSVVDFFYKSSYLDAKGEERPCYEVTRLGCDFLANKSTGEKGVIFTARYVKRFQEMENQVKKIPAWQIPVGEVASYLKAMDRVAVRQNLAPYKIAEAFKVVSERFGIMLPADFVRIPEYEQMEMEL
jgi:phage regulator Rha-like protein